MRKYLATALLAVLTGVLGFAVSGVAVAGVSDKPSSPPGQEECEHGNAAKPCKDDPQPDKGKDCETHGNNGGVNEDHCNGVETTTTDTTTTDTTTTDTTTTDTTTTDTTPQTTTRTDGSQPNPPALTGSSGTTSTDVPSSNSSDTSPATPTVVGLPPVAESAKKQAAAKEQPAVLSATANAPKPTRQAQQAPLTL